MAAATGGHRRRWSGKYLSKTSSPAHLTLPRGAEVEVRLDGEGFHGSWYEATVVDFAPANGRRVRDYTTTYSHLVADDGCSALTEIIPFSQVRPRPPPPSESSSPPRFHLYDIVEAFHYDGWWTGIVMSTLDSPDPEPGASATATVTVGFPITRETIEFSPHLVRRRRDYVDGHWVLSRAAMAAPSFKLRVYKVGEKVEVGRHRDFYGYSWYPATVAWVVDELSYVVDYGEGKAAEYVHWQFIRPALEHFCRDSESELQLEPGNEVEAYCRGAWSLGEVEKVIRGKWKYKVIVGNKKEYLLVTKVVELLKPINNWNNWIGNRRRIVAAKRPSANLSRVSMSRESPRPPVDVTSNGDEQHSHAPESPATKKSRKDLKQLDSILAEGSEHSPHCSLVMDTPLSDQNRNDHVCADHSANQVAKSNCVMETAIPSLDYRVQEAGREVDQQAGGKVDQQAGGEVDESSGFLRRLKNARSSQSTIDSPPFRSRSASENLLPSPLADGKPLFVKSSPVWPQIEAMDVFSAYPQRPHFLPLRGFSPTMHEGMALGLVAVFSDLVRIIRKASIDNSMEWFQDKFSILCLLEGHGFSVQYLHSTLTKLVKIKSQHTICLEEMDKLDVEIEVEIASLTRIGALLDEKDSVIAELEQKLSKFKEACGDAKREFHSVLAALPGSS
ncbi:hypothetical protein BDA96_10G325900 [Sorghum bicolor]|uniref:Agenet domain-containing protein n=2 Tax=Sorghum bicolor TaxID=4558 RepID=A0A921Q5M0_SORBI|nr:DUF724 domain-containing protein 3 [Sorghum bicolor]KAG0515999.1 hypothetical protein BDA96_10G325900 [Sorghum bicolor]KAG0516000.1 hypothetical protein BDA96_10G325900 [Sorghum bicolor]OQU76996.1 hypothetical protein SORBI_3010G251900 [Sorghum bicolor]OQU76997.1 hypothetical protein SORBI_3010G251900 [Sorghum bicolor]OQU76998.1 hypothetical protein SORBI_3010G251900 [Sorghum bicolor]|eukprot:XP_002438961.1 DUF724 domain-containing protein 3 [Sorghum bicolor]